MRYEKAPRPATAGALFCIGFLLHWVSASLGFCFIGFQVLGFRYWVSGIGFQVLAPPVQKGSHVAGVRRGGRSPADPAALASMLGMAKNRGTGAWAGQPGPRPLGEHRAGFPALPRVSSSRPAVGDTHSGASWAQRDGWIRTRISAASSPPRGRLLEGASPHENRPEAHPQYPPPPKRLPPRRGPAHIRIRRSSSP